MYNIIYIYIYILVAIQNDEHHREDLNKQPQLKRAWLGISLQHT